MRILKIIAKYWMQKVPRTFFFFFVRDLSMNISAILKNIFANILKCFFRRSIKSKDVYDWRPSTKCLRIKSSDEGSKWNWSEREVCIMEIPTCGRTAWIVVWVNKLNNLPRYRRMAKGEAALRDNRSLQTLIYSLIFFDRWIRLVMS